MKPKVQKWGNGLALRIPKALAIVANVASGSTVEMSLSNGELKIKPIEDQEYMMEELLSGITAENIHEEVSTGIPQRKECISGAVLSDKTRSLDWRVRDAQFICKLSESTVSEVLKKLSTLLKE